MISLLLHETEAELIEVKYNNKDIISFYPI